MASISTDKNGNRRLFYVLKKGERSALYLGPISMKAAEAIKTKIEALIASLRANIPLDGATLDWLAKLEDDFYQKLSDNGLVSPRQVRAVITMAAFIDDYISKHTKWKKGTKINHGTSRRWIVQYFGAMRDVKTVTEENAQDFRLHMEEHIGENTLRKICSHARQYYKAMGKRDRSIENPFLSMKNISVEGNEARFFFVSRELSDQVIRAMPNAEWRVIFGLCRFAGFRCSSDVHALKWSDIDWKKRRINFNSPKTGRRELPLFPELVPLLKDLQQVNEYVINQCRDESRAHSNLSTSFLRYLRKAGIKRWPKLFQNLRSTRETELMEIYPAHVVCKWIGNTEAVARKHYLQLTDEHFERATTQIPTQLISGDARKPTKPKTATTKSVREMQYHRSDLRISSTPDRISTYGISAENTSEGYEDDADNDALSGLLGF